MYPLVAALMSPAVRLMLIPSRTAGHHLNAYSAPAEYFILRLCTILFDRNHKEHTDVNPNENQNNLQNPYDRLEQVPTPQQPIPTEQPNAPQPQTPSQEVPQSEIPAPSPFGGNQAPVQPSAAPQPSFNQPAAVQSQPSGASFAPTPAPSPSNGSKGLAIASLVLGILGFLTSGLGIGILLGLIGLVLGVITVVKHRAGKGLAIAGIITGAIAFVFGGIFFAITLVAYQGIQERALESKRQSEQRQQERQDALNESNDTLSN